MGQGAKNEKLLQQTKTKKFNSLNSTHLQLSSNFLSFFKIVIKHTTLTIR